MRFTAADIAIPDSQLARDITELVRDTPTPARNAPVSASPRAA